MATETAIAGGAGVAAPRRNFAMPETDQDFLDASYPGWETIMQGATPWLILTAFPVPTGYNVSEVMAAIQISVGYPNAPLDMVYFCPALARANGRPIQALAPMTIDGRSWQRWSRHYPWRVGIDDLATHIERIKNWLNDELSR